MKDLKLKRRSTLRLLGGLAVGSALTPLINARAANAQSQSDDPRFLIVIGASGGASIIDAMLAIRESESANAATLNCFPDAVVTDIADSPFRATTQQFSDLGAIPQPFSADQVPFVNRHKDDMLVATWTRTSVNHGIAQRRAVTGNEAFSGRTLQELVASTYGEAFALPNVHLQQGNNVTQRGTDNTLPRHAFGEVVTDPITFPLSLDGQLGTNARHLPRDLLNDARAVRDDELDTGSQFSRIFSRSERLRHWRAVRDAPRVGIEAAGLTEKLMLVEDSPVTPLSSVGLSPSPDLETVRAQFPDMDIDPLEAQAALGFLLLKNRVSTTVTLGPGQSVVIPRNPSNNDVVRNPPIAFDFSHQSHRATQAFMWKRTMDVVDGLIALLKAEEFAPGESMWERTMIYIAPDFGRSKTRPANSTDWGTGHDLNNGVLMISPLVQGNTILGGVDPDTGLTYGFDPQTGAPDLGRQMEEAEIFSGMLNALGVDLTGSGLPSVPAMARS